MNKVFIGLGSNVGDKQNYILSAIEHIEQSCHVLKQSSLYETEPVGPVEQDWFLNAVICAKTEMLPMELFVFFQQIEKQIGRKKRIKNGPREIDLDILFYGDKIIKEDGLQIPHSRLHERKFVLTPLLELAPNFVHPVLKKTVHKILTELDDDEKVVKLIK